MTETDDATSQLLWAQPDWIAEVHSWIYAEMDRLRLPISGPIEQPHIRPWSTVMRFSSGDETLFFKATAEYEGYETAVTAALSDWQLGNVPEVLAADTERSWMLIRDVGITLRNHLKENRDIKHWETILRLYARLQRQTVTRTKQLISLGTPDHRLAMLPHLLTAFLDDEQAISLGHPNGLTHEERAQLSAFVPRLTRLCERLAALGIPETLDHNDLHANNVFVSSDRYTVADWGDCCVTHPFSTLTIALLSASRTLELPEDGPEIAALRDVYLEEWAGVAPPDAIQEALKLIPWVGMLNRALTWNQVRAGLVEPWLSQFGESGPGWLQELLRVELPADL